MEAVSLKPEIHLKSISEVLPLSQKDSFFWSLCCSFWQPVALPSRGKLLCSYGFVFAWSHQQDCLRGSTRRTESVQTGNPTCPVRGSTKICPYFHFINLSVAGLVGSYASTSLFMGEGSPFAGAARGCRSRVREQSSELLCSRQALS